VRFVHKQRKFICVLNWKKNYFSREKKVKPEDVKKTTNDARGGKAFVCVYTITSNNNNNSSNDNLSLSLSHSLSLSLSLK